MPTGSLDIVRFVRTPEGNGLAAVRLGGTGDVWTTHPRSERLRYTASWAGADFVVPLNKGL